MKKIAKQSYNHTVKGITNIYNIKSSTVKAKSSLTYTFKEDFSEATLSFKPKKINLVHFISPTVLAKVKAHYYVRRKGAARLKPFVKVKVKRAGGYKLLKGGVFANMLTGLSTAKSLESHLASVQITEREWKTATKRYGRLPIKPPLTGLSVAQMVKNDVIVNNFRRYVQEKGAKIIIHEVNVATGKIKTKKGAAA